VIPTADYVTNVKVVRRPLNNLEFLYAGLLAHSALLLETQSGKKFIVEYMGDSKVHSTNIGHPSFTKVETSTVEFRAPGAAMSGVGSSIYTWTSQRHGTNVNVEDAITVGDVEAQMTTLMSGRSYSVALPSHNCHEAQERTRRHYGWLRTTGDHAVLGSDLVLH